MLQSYLEELKKTRMLERDEELQLWQAAADGDLQAHQQLMTAYQPLVFKIAVSFQLPESETMELIQEGMVGLLEASETYDHTKNVAFSLFASYRIKGCMIDFLKKSADKGLVYLDSGKSSGVAMQELIASAAVSPAEWTEKKLLQEKITQAIDRLPEKEQCVLTGMYLEDKTAQNIADSINVSLGYVYRLQKQGVRRVRGMLSRFIHDFNKS